MSFSRFSSTIVVVVLLELLLLLQLSSSSFAWGYDNSNVNDNRDDNKQYYANQFPTLSDTIEMAKLSKLVYHFRHYHVNSDDDDDDYCDIYNNHGDSSIDIDGLKCEWYTHNHILGTQVLLVTNPTKNYIAVVFAGTDDIRTTLEDVHLTQKPYGNNSTISLKDKSIKVHSGFDNAVFSHGLWEDIYTRVTQLIEQQQQQLLQQQQTNNPSTPSASTTRIFTAGHSLGAANSILVATGLSLMGYKVQSINFGCPKTGNDMWKEYFDTTTTTTSSSNKNNNDDDQQRQDVLLKNRLSIWRIVLGWDLIPRLPDFNFYHVGHTIQIWTKYDHNHNIQPPDATLEVEAYYQHYGNTTLGYVGPPKNWDSVPHYYFPVDWMYHFMSKYVNHLEDLQYYYDPELWVNSFKTTSNNDIDDDDDDDNDDDYYIPPDDYYEMDELVF